MQKRASMGQVVVQKIEWQALSSVLVVDRRQLPDSPGIYFVLGTDNQVFYVGRAQSLRQRWSQHHRLAEFLSIAEGKIAWLPVAAFEQLHALECAYIALYAPPYNMATPQRSPDMSSSWPPLTQEKSLGSRTHACRKALQWTQAELALRAHVSQGLVARIETGKVKDPASSITLRLARALGVTADWLIGMYDEDDSPTPCLVGASP